MQIINLLNKFRIFAQKSEDNYQLPTKVKDNFFIVIGFTENEISLLSMTTSQLYFSPSFIKH